ncbi:MAG: 3-dehydroquinate synthase family protein [Candidatus Algichlamydia australiensis]|nr:3-dehydroquinate synthase family protein [Chlamydiales bacterium]
MLPFLEKFFENYHKETHFIVITDENVKQIWGEKLLHNLTESGYLTHLFAFTPGESNKNLSIYNKIVEAIGQCSISKKTHIIGFGGGVVTDMAGFVAATYRRGVPLTLIPTTLLAMIDASIGGKNGLNTSAGKNLIGTIYPPQYLFSDTTFLSTLPLREWHHGASEVLKAALIYSEEFFRFLEDSPLFWQEQKTLAHALRIASQIKSEICQKDPFEKLGLRTLLNFGHTIGHALERLSGYRMPHGEAVAKGLYAEALLSGLDETSLSRIEMILQKWNFDPYLPSIPTKDWMSALAQDKKKGMVKLERIGRASRELTPIQEKDLCVFERVTLAAK